MPPAHLRGHARRAARSPSTATPGKPCAGFGANGQVDLTAASTSATGAYQVTSAPAIAGDLVIVGSSIGDNRAVDVERGIVRAFDARTGALRWSWDPIPWASAARTPRTGGGNAWSTLSVDASADLVFVPTGSASPDYYGGIRKGDNKWANSVVALRAATGELVWGFQVVHHDLWDYDVAAQPTLFAWKDGTPAVAIDDEDGPCLRARPPHRRRRCSRSRSGAVPESDVPGEEASPTQPFSGISLVPERLDAERRLGRHAGGRMVPGEDRRVALGGHLHPAQPRGTIVFPGIVGGVNWGSAALRSPAPPARREHQPPGHSGAAHSRARSSPNTRAREQDGAVRGEFARAARHALRDVSRAPLLAPGGLPCNAPPWGTVAAVDLFSGKQAVGVPLGHHGSRVTTGAINLGGPIVTAGGLVFTAAAMDGRLRAFDSETGKELWAYELPAGGQATPMTYSARRQAVPGHRRRRPRQDRHEAGGLRAGVHPAVMR